MVFERNLIYPLFICCLNESIQLIIDPLLSGLVAPKALNHSFFNVVDAPVDILFPGGNAGNNC